MSEAPNSYVSRGGLKLAHALQHFAIDVQRAHCVDMGCSTGGFTDCLLQLGAERVYSIDTAYGVLAWRLRNDPRVVVLERTNALHAPVLADVLARGGAECVVIDASWTPQRLVIPAALRWLSHSGAIITLIKPHYEHKALGRALPHGGVLEQAAALAVTHEVCGALRAQGLDVSEPTLSPVEGGKRGKSAKGTGNAEYLAVVRR